MSAISKDPAWPVIVRIDGEPASAAMMNRKAFRKSIETGVPWIVHPETGRVLPWPGDPRTVSLNEAPGRYELSLPAAAVTDPYGADTPPDVDPDDRLSMDDTRVPENGGVKADGIMESLSVLIAERRRTMPEGSYTTYLFEKGLDKIRKKTGEEAIELLLARDDKDLVYESADLIYHLLVLLEASGLNWSEVTGELTRRYGE